MPTIIDKFIAIGTIILLLFLAYLVVICSYSLYVEQECLKTGYSEASITLNLKAYCISWIDATKVVVPFEEIK